MSSLLNDLFTKQKENPLYLIIPSGAYLFFISVIFVDVGI
jgi:hypothetical protein